MEVASPDELRTLIISTFSQVPFPFGNVSPEHSAEIAALLSVDDDFSLMDKQSDRADFRSNLLCRFCLDLLALSPAQVHYALPRLMIAVIDDYPDSMLYVDSVVTLLNVPSTISHEVEAMMLHGKDDEQREWATSLLDRLTQGRGYFENAKTVATSLLSQEQIGSVIAWMRFLRELLTTNDDLSSSSMINEIDAGIWYWMNQHLSPP